MSRNVLPENPAFRCHGCHNEPDWSITRCGDVVRDWACNEHLAAVCTHLQRDHEVTGLVVRDYRKAVEWASISRTLDSIASNAANRPPSPETGGTP